MFSFLKGSRESTIADTVETATGWNRFTKMVQDVGQKIKENVATVLSGTAQVAAGATIAGAVAAAPNASVERAVGEKAMPPIEAQAPGKVLRHAVVTREMSASEFVMLNFASENYERLVNIKTGQLFHSHDRLIVGDTLTYTVTEEQALEFSRVATKRLAEKTLRNETEKLVTTAIVPHTAIPNKGESAHSFTLRNFWTEAGWESLVNIRTGNRISSPSRLIAGETYILSRDANPSVLASLLKKQAAVKKRRPAVRWEWGVTSGEEIVEKARNFLKRPYALWGDGDINKRKWGIDCSGLIHQSLKLSGIIEDGFHRLTSGTIANLIRSNKKSPESVNAGDVIYLSPTKRGGYGHVMMVSGAPVDGKIPVIQASGSQGKVIEWFVHYARGMLLGTPPWVARSGVSVAQVSQPTPLLKQDVVVKAPQIHSTEEKSPLIVAQTDAPSTKILANANVSTSVPLLAHTEMPTEKTTALILDFNKYFEAKKIKVGLTSADKDARSAIASLHWKVRGMKQGLSKITNLLAQNGDLSEINEVFSEIQKNFSVASAEFDRLSPYARASSQKRITEAKKELENGIVSLGVEIALVREAQDVIPVAQTLVSNISENIHPVAPEITTVVASAQAANDTIFKLPDNVVPIDVAKTTARKASFVDTVDFTRSVSVVSPDATAAIKEIAVSNIQAQKALAPIYPKVQSAGLQVKEALAEMNESSGIHAIQAVLGSKIEYGRAQIHALNTACEYAAVDQVGRLKDGIMEISANIGECEKKNAEVVTTARANNVIPLHPLLVNVKVEQRKSLMQKLEKIMANPDIDKQAKESLWKRLEWVQDPEATFKYSVDFHVEVLRNCVAEKEVRSDEIKKTLAVHKDRGVVARNDKELADAIHLCKADWSNALREAQAIETLQDYLVGFEAIRQNVIKDGEDAMQKAQNTAKIQKWNQTASIESMKTLGDIHSKSIEKIDAKYKNPIDMSKKQIADRKYELEMAKKQEFNSPILRLEEELSKYNAELRDLELRRSNEKNIEWAYYDWKLELMGRLEKAA